MPALTVNASDSTPIWSQIEEGMRRLVASRALAPGAAVPSVRELARDLSVNPATVAKAYQRLTDIGIFTVRRGDGTYVADSPPLMGRPQRQKALREGADRFATLGATLGASAEEGAREVKDAWRRLAPRREGGGK
jgi:GntR family transcriptional regulator